MWRRLLVMLLLAVAYVGLSWWGASLLLHPPRHRAAGTPADLGLTFESLTLTTSDGVDLAAWAAEPEGPACGAVLLFHGIEGHRSPAQMRFLADHGFRTLAVDHRAHGDSGGRMTGFGYHERLDVQAAAAWARARWPDGPLLAWGTSMGAAALVFAVREAREAGVPGALGPFDALVLESMYADIPTAFDNRVELHFGAWMRPLLWGTRVLVAWRGDLDIGAMRPVDILGSLESRHLLLARGGADRLVTEDDFARLQAVAPDATIVVVPDVPHVPLLVAGGPAFRRRVVEFFQASCAP